jgi:hypothetical protein
MRERVSLTDGEGALGTPGKAAVGKLWSTM